MTTSLQVGPVSSSERCRETFRNSIRMPGMLQSIAGMADVVLITTLPLIALGEGLGRPCTTNFLYNQMPQSTGQNCAGYKVGFSGYVVFAVLILIFKFVIKCFRLGIPAT